ncbi:hypothetical protein CKM354_000702200 [Cercospora kikuchii]|uniref:TFIIF beta subunit HTH domain-containing protein n=1 Tax=Cercospora kikuchii TaxID=84275 RepID=A0A9P3CGB1_9PEZI|nr:uncharacterized protein CKM354_000702200 [Cercospora kikuchii]GIZ43809.1 hypothetical protein CKM354_000702200 [Cercospora kikuchii]
MTNRPYEIDVPSLTKLKAMEDDAMGSNPATAPETPKVVRQDHAASEGSTPVAGTDSAKRQNLQQCLPEDDPNGQRGDASPTDLRETGRMDVDVGTEDQALNSHEMITRCEGHWLFANAVLEERQLGVRSQAKGKGKGKGKEVEPRASPIPAPYIEESMQSNAEVDDLCMHKSDPTLPDSTAEGQEYLVPKDDLLIMLEVGFAERPYWTTADLADALQQPGTYLNEVLPQIAIFGPWLGGYPQRWCWRLKVAEEKSEGRWKGKGRAESWE